MTDANWRAIAAYLEGRGIHVPTGLRDGSITTLDAARSLAAMPAHADEIAAVAKAHFA